MSSRRKWLCLDCRIDTGKAREHYFIESATWMGAVGSKRGMLCVGCLEGRLGRRLTSSDFPKAHINDPRLCPMSDRLRERMAS